MNITFLIESLRFPFFEVTIDLPTMSLNMERVERNSDLGKAKIINLW